MALVPLVSAADAADADREAVESGYAQYDQLLHTWGAILNRPGLFAVYLPFLRQVASPGAVDPGIKDASALLVGYLNGCRYTVSHRYASAKRNGVPDDVLRAAVSGEWSSLEPAMRSALELTRAMTSSPTKVPFATEPQIAHRDVLDEASRRFDDEQLVELTMSISVWNGLSRFHRVMGFDLDMPAAPQDLEPQ